MKTLEQTLEAIPTPDLAAAKEVQTRLDQKTKPPRSLGRLEDLACTLAAIRGTADLELPRKAVVVMAGDHGVAEEGVSAFPQEVTAQMVLNFAAGGAGINVLARQAGAEVLVVDMGVKSPLPASPAIRSVRVAPGTANLARGAAMTRAQATAALEAGIAISNELADRGVTLLAIGEMGIANTTAASALTSAFTGLPPAEVTGRGTGIDDVAHRRKVEVIARALRVNRPDPADPLGVLAALGGLEIAGLAGVVLGAAARRVPVLTDGFIATSAALCAVRLAPRAGFALLASHRSVEAGHRHLLAALGKEPLFDLDLRLGEGTGAALAMSLVEASVRILREMATFASAGVSGKA
ncbi:MAG TPA: nicotinate-nucleotide--dimethylbenzimidazole phosphoribosyltransferase [Anaeromyxobacteraceae bacterium]|nr:nicotinate-nucleotide--dimethylbenzimidazole phosphoribosyltransferase [Anaeromyxobacteraceae bacterium]